MQSLRWQFFGIVSFFGLTVGSPTVYSLSAQEKRARPPQFDAKSFPDVFFGDLSSVVGPDRPSLSTLRGSGGGVSGGMNNNGLAGLGSGTAGSDSAAGGTTPGAGQGGKWQPLTEPIYLEDEVKRIKLHYDSVVTTPGRFKSGDFKIARVDLAVLATLMAVIHEYEGNVRFKQDAAVARDNLARSAITVAGGSDTVFNDAMQRKAELQDLISGAGLNRTAEAKPNDWSIITTRSPLMEYLQQLMDETLTSETNDAASVAAAIEDLKRSGAMVAVISEVLNQEGMEGADDGDYREFSNRMKQAALALQAALEQNDANAARLAVGEISKSCDACHEQYR
jgi:cytochrome c556